MKLKRTFAFFLLSFLSTILFQTHVVAQESLASERYIDPKGFFRIVPPANWSVQEYPQDARGKVAFFSPDRTADLRILVNSVEFSTIEELISWCKDFEKKVGINSHIKQTTFNGYPTVERMFEKNGLKILMIDFLIGKIDHNLMFSAPPQNYERYRPIVFTSMGTYEPISKDLKTKQDKQLQIAKSIRLAQLMIEQGNMQLASECVTEGLKIDPNDPSLIELKQQIGQANPPETAEQIQEPNLLSQRLEEGNEETVATRRNPEQKSEHSDAETIIGGLFAFTMIVIFLMRVFGLTKKKSNT